MNRQLSLDDSPLTHPRRRAAMALASVTLLGASMTACSSGDNGADAASAPDGTTASTDAEISTDAETAAGNADGGPQFSQDGAPGMGGGPGGIGGLGGEVTAIDGSTITIENQGRDGTTTELTVETSVDTTVTATSDGTIDDLAIGDTVMAIGVTDDDEFVASMITEGTGAMGGPVFQGGGPGGPGDGQPPLFVDGEGPDGTIPAPPDDAPIDRQVGPMAGRLVNGTIVAIGDSTITVESADGAETVVNLSSDTTVTVSVDKELSDIEVGTTIRVSGDDTDGTIEASTIIIAVD